MRLPLAKTRLLTVVLVCLNLCALAMLIQRIWQGTQAAQLLATTAKPFPVPELNIGVPTRTATFSVIQDQPLFYASRRFYTPPPASTLPAVPPKPDYRLVGTFVIPDKPTVALLTSSAGMSRKVKTGDDLDGWTVQAIEVGRVTLQYQTTTADISSAGSGGKPGMQVVPLTRSAQSMPTDGVRILGAAVQGASAPRSGLPIPNSNPRLYQPPPLK
jgi:hypothetical protein